MARTESKAMTVHPDDEQSRINLMQKFHWSLLSSQEVKTVDSHLESNWSGDKIQSVTKTEHYVKLAFSRELDLLHLKEIKQLENEYFSPPPVYPKLFPVSIWLWVVGSFVYGIGVVGWLIYFFTSYKPKKEKADKDYAILVSRREQIMKELENYG